MLQTFPTRRLSLLAAVLLLQAGWAWSQALPTASPESVGVSSQRLESSTTAAMRPCNSIRCFVSTP